MKARAVIGANFGDEGKGLVTDWLCSQGDVGAVVRFNGGAQAGHTVVTPEGERHVFRHIGSGTFCGVPTFLSQFFVVNPILFHQERQQLIELGFHPEVYAHPDCLVTTHVDMLINQFKERGRGVKRHGSCGIGFHETITRSTVPELRITLADLWNMTPSIEKQLEEICTKYAAYRMKGVEVETSMNEAFIEACRDFAQFVQPLGIGQIESPLFEGAQGLLLDMDRKEFFPHVTHSHTGMENVRELCKQAGISDVEAYYVSRTYLTRHGYGPLPGEDAALRYEDKTNATNEWQGDLRFAPLDDGGLLARCREDACGQFKLVVTHTDQHPWKLKGIEVIEANGETRNHVK